MDVPTGSTGCRSSDEEGWSADITGDADTPPTSATPSSVSQLNTAQDIGGTRVVDFVAICSYISGMKTVSIRDAKNRLTALAREVERGETVVVTRNGRPAFDLVPHQTRKGLRLEAIDEFKRKHRIKAIVPYIADDFDEALPEDFLLRPLPVDR